MAARFARGAGDLFDGVGTNAIMRQTGNWHWQERFMQEGVDGLPRQDPP
jgi:hypothetical protein